LKDDSDFHKGFGQYLLKTLFDQADNDVNIHGDSLQDELVSNYRTHKLAALEIVEQLGPSAEVGLLAWHFFNLGYLSLASKLSPDEKRLHVILEENKSAKKGRSGLENRNFVNRLWQDFVNQTAKELWSQDSSRQMTAVEMTEKVYPILESVIESAPLQGSLAVFSKYHPQYETVHKWILKAAPKYAKPKGARRKK